MTVKVPGAVMLAELMPSVNAATTAALVETPAETGLVTGTVAVTIGRVVSGIAPVVKVQTFGLGIVRPVATLRAPVTVAV